jgi:DNA-binding NarL/FixJ family response regulator
MCPQESLKGAWQPLFAPLDFEASAELLGNTAKHRWDRTRAAHKIELSVLAHAVQWMRQPANKTSRCVSEMSNLRILVADDHDIIRRGLKALLSSRPGWVVCGEAATGREAVTLAEQHKPDVVVMDISMPDLNGLEAARKIRKHLPKTEVVVLSLHYSDQLVREVVDAGARAYIMKSDADRDLLIAIEALANHRSFFTSRAAEMLIDGFCRQSSITEPRVLMRNRLTSREREIVQLLAEGRSSKEVAVTLGISVKTAETHRANIMRKLEMHSVSELVRYAVRNQIIEP